MSEADWLVLRAADWRLGLRWAEAAVIGYQLTVWVEEDRLVVAIGSPLKRDYISCAGMVAIFWVCASSARGRERLRTRCFSSCAVCSTHEVLPPVTAALLGVSFLMPTLRGFSRISVLGRWSVGTMAKRSRTSRWMMVDLPERGVPLTTM